MTATGTLTRVAAYACGLALLFGAAFALGAAAGPLRAEPASTGHPGGHRGETSGGAHDGSGEHHSTGTAAAAAMPAPAGGLATSHSGYTLTLDGDRLSAGRPVELHFTITGPDGKPVTDFTRQHGKRLHLIVVRRDLRGYQHLHPALDAATGRWSVPLILSAAGDYRVFADFTPLAGAPLTLGTDLHVAGRYRPEPLPAPASRTTVDGYVVTVRGALTPSTSAALTLAVSRDGRPVRDLQRYLAAYGHLVVLRDGDLAYLHVHPEESAHTAATAGGGPEVRFRAEVPSAGAYRLFFDFRHLGTVHTAELTVEATP